MRAKRTSKAGPGSRPHEPAPAPIAEPRPVRPRVLLSERDPEGATSIALALRAVGIEPVSCPDPKSLLEEAARQPADAVICELAVRCREDIFLLELLRRVAPSVPLILVASEGSLETQRLVLGLRPMYYAVGPLEGPELREAVEAALAPRNRPTAAAPSSRSPARSSPRS
jgi:DNA-binding response OmpR family regulator